MDNDYDRKAVALVRRANNAKTSDESFEILSEIAIERVTDRELRQMILWANDKAQIFIDLHEMRSRTHVQAQVRSLLNPPGNANPVLLAIAPWLRRLGWLGQLIAIVWLAVFPPHTETLPLTMITRWLRILLGRIGSGLALQWVVVRIPWIIQLNMSLSGRYSLPDEHLGSKSTDDAA